MANNANTISTASTVESMGAKTGALVDMAYATRPMNILPVSEDELELFGTMNAVSNFALTASTFFWGAAAGIVTNHAYAEKLTPEGKVLGTAGVGVLGVVGLLCFILFVIFQFKKSGIWKKIGGKKV